jgi:hypothetical protein
MVKTKGLAGPYLKNPHFSGFLPFDDGTIFREITPEGYVEGPFPVYPQRQILFYVVNSFTWLNAHQFGHLMISPFINIHRLSSTESVENEK